MKKRKLRKTIFSLLKAPFQILFFFVGLFFKLLVLYVLAAILIGLFPLNRDFVEPENGVEIYIASNGIHTDFILPVCQDSMDWRKIVPFADFKSPDTSLKYIGFGWGDKKFYLETPQWKNMKISTAFQAIFFLNSTALHVKYISQPIVESWKCEQLRISKKQYHSLCNYIQTTARRTTNGRWIHIGHAGYTGNDTFYEAIGAYSFFNTCNVWIGQGLRETGVWTPYWSPFHWFIFLYF